MDLTLLAFSCAETILDVSYGAGGSSAPRITDFRSDNDRYQPNRSLDDFILDHIRGWLRCVIPMSWSIDPLLLCLVGTSPVGDPRIPRWQSLSADHIDRRKRNRHCIRTRGVLDRLPNLWEKTPGIASEKIVRRIESVAYRNDARFFKKTA